MAQGTNVPHAIPAGEEEMELWPEDESGVICERCARSRVENTQSATARAARRTAAGNSSRVDRRHGQFRARRTTAPFCDDRHHVSSRSRIPSD